MVGFTSLPSKKKNWIWMRQEWISSQLVLFYTLKFKLRTRSVWFHTPEGFRYSIHHTHQFFFFVLCHKVPRVKSFIPGIYVYIKHIRWKLRNYTWYYNSYVLRCCFASTHPPEIQFLIASHRIWLQTKGEEGWKWCFIDVFSGLRALLKLAKVLSNWLWFIVS